MARVNVEIRNAALADVYELARNLRPKDREEIESAGLNPRRWLRDNFRRCAMARCATFDGRLACYWVVCPRSLISGEAALCLTTTPAVAAFPVTFVKYARHEIRGLSRTWRLLDGYVLASYAGAVRFLELLGFTLGDPVRLRGAAAPFRYYALRA